MTLRLLAARHLVLLRLRHFEMDALLADLNPLLTIQSARTIFRPKELHEAVSLLDTNLRQLAIRVEDVEDVALRDLLRAEVANEKSRASGKLLPAAFADVSALGFDEGIVFLLDFSVPRAIFWTGSLPSS